MSTLCIYMLCITANGDLAVIRNRVKDFVNTGLCEEEGKLEKEEKNENKKEKTTVVVEEK